MTVLLRDDFTGSGTLSGRTPDGVHGGTWANDPYWWGGDIATSTSIAGGILTSATVSAAWSGCIPLAGSPSDGYIEAGIVQSALDTSCDAYLALRVNTSTGAGVYCLFNAASATTVMVNLHRNGTPSTGVGSSGTYTVANALNFVARLEVSGLTASVYLNGTLVLAYTLTANTGGGLAEIQIDGASTHPLSFDYIEAGDLTAPVVPIFWTSFVGSHEVP